jgi:SAM-dependent methyltransferase
VAGFLHDALRRLPGARRVAMTARFGDVTRTHPLTEWGEERGTPVDRWYIERYLAQHREVIGGRVLEVKDDHYGSSLGAAVVEVVDIDAANPRATVVGDLCDAATLEPGRYDAAVVTQTLQLVGDPAAAVRNLLASLRPGGALVLTVPCLSRLCASSDLWRWTPPGVRRLLRDAAPEAAVVDVSGLGNGLAARGFLFGLAAEDLPSRALEVQDSEQPLVVGAVVRAPASPRR